MNMQTAKQTEKKEERKRRRSREKQTVSEAVTIDLSQNEIYEVLLDTTLSSEEQEQKIIDMLEIDLNSEEAVKESRENIESVKNIIKQLLNQFADHNRRSIELTRDNPLSKLSAGIQEVFDNYHKMNEGRSDLKNQLKTVDELLQDLGGEEKLVAAMVNAKTKTDETNKLMAEIEVVRKSRVQPLARSQELTRMERDFVSQLEDLKSGFFSFLNGSKVESLTKQLIIIQTDRKIALDELNQADAELAKLVDMFDELKNSDDFQTHQRILGILDIASPEFKEKLSVLSGVTLQYIDDTQMILTQVRDQLEDLLGQVDGSLDVNINIREQVTILSSALSKSNDRSIESLKTFKREAGDELSSLAVLENEKITREADIFIGELDDTVGSTAMIAAEVQKIEVVILSLRDQLKDGLLDANEQLLISINNATAGGMVMMNKAQTLGTLAQGVIAKGQYMQESEETFGNLAKEFQRGLATRAGRNDTLNSMTDIIHDISDALEDTNDEAADIILDKKELLKELDDSVSRLKNAAEEARQLQSHTLTGED